MRYDLWLIFLSLICCVRCADPRVLHSADRSVSKAETGTKQPLDEQMPMAKRFMSNREIAYAVILGLQFGLGALSFGLGYKAALIQHKIVPDPGYRKPNKEPKSRMYEE